MSWTFDSALEDDLITVLERDDQMGEFAVRVGELDTIVIISLGRFMNGEMTKFSVSHSIHTPTQAGPYRTSKPFAESPAYALHRAISGLTSYYRDAVKDGHKPSEMWLVKNT